MSRRFKLSEAQSLIPEVEQTLRSAISLKATYEQADAKLSQVTQRIHLAGGLLVDRSKLMETRQMRDYSAEQLKLTMENIQRIGCLVKDLDIGLIDFPTLFRGEEVYLCWRLGETDIRYWHGVDEGFAGRKPIDEDFIANHRGDAPH